MVRTGVMEDYTYLWYDVAPPSALRHRRDPGLRRPDPRRARARPRRPHPGHGARAVRALRRRRADSSRLPWERLDENKWLAARHGMDAELAALERAGRHQDLARRLGTVCAGHARTLGSAGDLDGVIDLIDARKRRGTPARGLRGEPRFHGADVRDRRGDGLPTDVLAEKPARNGFRCPLECPTLTSSSSARSCGSEVSPYVTECPYCGRGCAVGPKYRARRGRAQATARRVASAGQEGARSALRALRLNRLRPNRQLPASASVALNARPWATRILLVAPSACTSRWRSRCSCVSHGARTAAVRHGAVPERERWAQFASVGGCRGLRWSAGAPPPRALCRVLVFAL